MTDSICSKCPVCNREYEYQFGALAPMRLTVMARKPKAKAKAKPSSIATMERWMSDGVAKATDGCRVEPDGTCPHGHPSWLIKLGLI